MPLLILGLKPVEDPKAVVPIEYYFDSISSLSDESMSSPVLIV
jgi:hypothetical protein